MIVAVEEYLGSALRPPSELRRERTAGDDRRVSPMIGHDQHRHAIADVGTQGLDQRLDLALEPGRDIVDRSEKNTGHRVNMPRRAWIPPLKKLHLMLGRFPGSTLTDADRRRQRLLLAAGRRR